MLNYIDTLLLQIWLFLKHLRGLNCTILCSSLWPNMLLFLTYAHSVIPLLNLYKIASTTAIFATGAALHNAVYAVHIKKKVTLHSTATLMWMYAATGQKRTCCWPAAAAVFTFTFSLLYYWYLMLLMLSCNIHLITYHVTAASYMAQLRDCTLCSMFNSVGLLCNSSNYTSRQVSCEPAWSQLFVKSTKLLNCTQQLLWLSEVSGHACCFSDALLSQRSLLDKIALCSFMRLQHLWLHYAQCCHSVGHGASINIEYLVFIYCIRSNKQEYSTPAMTKAIIWQI